MGIILANLFLVFASYYTTLFSGFGAKYFLAYSASFSIKLARFSFALMSVKDFSENRLKSANEGLKISIGIVISEIIECIIMGFNTKLGFGGAFLCILLVVISFICEYRIFIRMSNKEQIESLKNNTGKIDLSGMSKPERLKAIKLFCTQNDGLTNKEVFDSFTGISGTTFYKYIKEL